MIVHVQTRRGETLIFSSSEIDELYDAAEDALAHVKELREAWERGILSEHDDKGGTRSNRNVEVAVKLTEALRGNLNG